MILKILLKIWPALLPLTIYFLWVMTLKILTRRGKKGNFVEGEFQEINKDGQKINEQKPSPFSLNNKYFIITLYLSLISLIISFIFFAFTK